MARLTERVRALRRSGHLLRLVKFGAVSVVSTVVTQSILFLCYDVLTVGSAMVCNVIATSCATVPAYWLNRTWTWGKRGKSHPWKEVAPFWIIAFAGLVLSTVAVGIAAHNADQISHSHLARKVFVQLANFFTYGCIWVARYVIFNRYLFGPRTITGPVGAISFEQQIAEGAEPAAQTVPVAGQAGVAQRIVVQASGPPGPLDDGGPTAELPVRSN